ncbi:MAG: aminoacetone oxidase family FAD-binding enzyme [Gemmatimonadales bacterium]|nr:aminoacetone oxidase family FAD-binding enzyme [Gemmatimonadales bacterium]
MDSPRIIIVGAGAAGLLAAGRAAELVREAGREREVEVVLLERMRQVGRKIRISGKGRCNLSNTLPANEFIKHFNRSGRFLHQTFSRFFTEDLLELLNNLDLPTVVERGGRIFPADGSAVAVAEILEAWARGLGVRVITGAHVRGLDCSHGRVRGLHYDLFSEHGKAGSGGDCGATKLAATAILLATGGKSYPTTGSTGDGHFEAENLGHKIIRTRPSLVPLKAEGAPPSGVSDLKLRNVGTTLRINGKTHSRHFGELHFTKTGLGGPVVLEISRVVVAALDGKKSPQPDLELAVDLKPALDVKKLDARLIRDLDSRDNATWGDLLAGLLPRELLPTAERICSLPLGKPCHQITGPERRVLRDWLKDWRFPITGFGGFPEAIVTAGGVDTKEVDPHSMESRLVPGLYIMGELLDVDADTGGFNLMAAFSTGWVGGEAAARSVLTTLES